MAELPVEIQRDIEWNADIPFDGIVDMDWSEIHERIEQRSGGKITFHLCDDPRLECRDVLLTRPLDTGDLERKLKRI